MVVFKMPLDMFTLLIGAIALGLAVDDTVHLCIILEDMSFNIMMLIRQ